MCWCISGFKTTINARVQHRTYMYVQTIVVVLKVKKILETIYELLIFFSKERRSVKVVAVFPGQFLL